VGGWSTTEVSSEVFVTTMFILVGGNSGVSEYDRSLRFRVAACRDLVEEPSLGRFVDGEPGYPGFGCIALCGMRCALDPSRLRRRSRIWRNKYGAIWVSRVDLEEGQLSTDDAQRLCVELARFVTAGGFQARESS